MDQPTDDPKPEEPAASASGTARDDANLAEQTFRRISAMILHRDLAPGAVIQESRLAEELEVSRTPLREALMRLEGRGLLERQGRRSMVVRRVTAAEYFQSMKVRELLEAEAISLAIPRIADGWLQNLADEVGRLSTADAQEKAHWAADDQLHGGIADASGNGVLAAVIREVRVRTRLFEVMRPFHRITRDAEEHREIIDAMAARDQRAARRAMLRHLRNLQKEVLEILCSG